MSVSTFRGLVVVAVDNTLTKVEEHESLERRPGALLVDFDYLLAPLHILKAPAVVLVKDLAGTAETGPGHPA